jgi:hypothetical protein
MAANGAGNESLMAVNGFVDEAGMVGRNLVSLLRSCIIKRGLMYPNAYQGVH